MTRQNRVVRGERPLVPRTSGERAEAVLLGAAAHDARVANRPRLPRPARVAYGLEVRADDGRREARASEERGVNDTRTHIVDPR